MPISFLFVFPFFNHFTFLVSLAFGCLSEEGVGKCVF